MVKPIPLHLLIHTVEYHEYDPEGQFQDSYKDSVTINNVRVEPSSKVVTNSNGESVTSKATLFVDSTFSNPIPNFLEKSKIVFNGKEYYVHVVDTLYAMNNTPHHWELIL
ncbi:putative minor capsid protein [Lysinibacillus sp. RS5]|uniref:putative minor capsid protein n=1 Tax=unclassified Lysinibacillus TaxID=2636778 RepID=UPI0035BE6BB4